MRVSESEPSGRLSPACGVRKGRDAWAGFSLAELVVVVMIVGIVAGIALPNIRSALFMAEAVHIVSDVSTIRLAAYTYLSETGDFPSSGGFGIAPPQLANHLPDGFPFTYKNVEYAFWSFNLFGGGGFWGTKKLGIVMVSFPNQPELAQALESHMGPDALWGTTIMWFLLRG